MEELELPNKNGGGVGVDCRSGKPRPDVDVDEDNSSCSTPYYSAPSSPVRVNNPGYYFSAPASPMHFVLSTIPIPSAVCDSCDEFGGGQGSCDFEFSARFTCPDGATAMGSMLSADELFLNGQIRPMKLSTHLRLLDLGNEGEEVGHKEEVVRRRESKLRCGSLHRRARSMSPLRTTPTQWTEGDEEGGGKHDGSSGNLKIGCDGLKESDDMQSVASTSASSSRSNSSSSTSRNGKRWVFLKGLLYRSKSEGRGNGKDKFWQSIYFHQTKDRTTSSLFSFKEKSKVSSTASVPKKQNLREGMAAKKAPSAATAASTVGKRRMPPCERHYTANRSHAEEMRKRTFLPYRQGVLGCLGFTWRGYGAVNGLAGALNPVSSR